MPRAARAGQLRAAQVSMDKTDWSRGQRWKHVHWLGWWFQLTGWWFQLTSETIESVEPTEDKHLQWNSVQTEDKTKELWPPPIVTFSNLSLKI